MFVLPAFNSLHRVHGLTGQQARTQAARTYLTCVVRLSSEKEPERFAALVEQLAARGALARHGLVPFLLAAADTVRGFLPEWVLSNTNTTVVRAPIHVHGG